MFAWKFCCFFCQIYGIVNGGFEGLDWKAIVKSFYWKIIELLWSMSHIEESRITSSRKLVSTNDFFPQISTWSMIYFTKIPRTEKCIKSKYSSMMDQKYFELRYQIAKRKNKFHEFLSSSKSASWINWNWYSITIFFLYFCYLVNILSKKFHQKERFSFFNAMDWSMTFQRKHVLECVFDFWWIYISFRGNLQRMFRILNFTCGKISVLQYFPTQIFKI